MLARGAAAALLLACLALPARAQFNQFIGFGDSTIDSGWYRNTTTGDPGRDAAIAAAVAHGGHGAAVGVGLMASELLAAYFGLPALPANQPGGTNFATGGARDSLPSASATTAVPTATQIANYLALSGGRANPSALYLIGSGGNDLIAISGLPIVQQNAAATAAANSLVGAIQTLSAAGARTIIVPDQMFGPPAQQSVRLLYDSTVWSGLAASGVSFVPADLNGVFRAIQQNPAQFGVTLGVGVPGPNTPSACVAPAGVTTAWGVLCAPVPTGSGTATLATPNAEQTRLFADDLHLSAAGQQIVADYYRELLLAPMEMSLLAETPLKTRAGVIAAIENQIPLSQRLRGSSGFNAWITGDIASIRINTTPGIAGESGLPSAVTAGLDYRPFDGLLFGAALSGGTQKTSFDFASSFRQDEFAVSLYAAALRGPWWLDLIGSYGHLNYDISRLVPIGISLQPNAARTGGDNVSFAAEGGYDFAIGAFRHGPVVGITLQRVRVDGFTEAGSFTSLAFGEQIRNSAVSEVGYRAELDAGMFRPFVKMVWNHELAATDRVVTASLTTIAAPAYTMPALEPGHDWGTGTIGVTATLAPRVTGLVSMIGQIGQSGATSLGGQAGVNVAF
jgi:outer membrane lipase/esterase